MTFKMSNGLKLFNLTIKNIMKNKTIIIIIISYLIIKKTAKRKNIWITHILPLPYNQIFYDYTYRKNKNKIWECGINITNCEKFIINYNKENSKINSILDIGFYQGNSLKRYAQHFEKLNQYVDLFGIDISHNLIEDAKKNTSNYNIHYELFNSSEFLNNKYPKALPNVDVMVFSDVLYCFSTKIIPSMGGKLWDILRDKRKDNFIKYIKSKIN
jgi:hypothetical protein